MAITYDSVTLTFAYHQRGTTDKAVKEIAYPGLDGLEEMDMGSRGKQFVVTGRIADTSNGTFNPETIETWKDDRDENTLVIGASSFTNVIVVDGSCDNFQTTPSGQTCTYSITFRKLR